MRNIILLLSALLATACTSLPKDETPAPTEKKPLAIDLSKWDPNDRYQVLNVLKAKAGLESDWVLAFSQVYDRYLKAIDAYGAALDRCSPKQTGTGPWLKHLQQRFTAEEQAKLGEDIVTAVVARQCELELQCLKKERDELLIAEFEFIPYRDQANEYFKEMASQAPSPQKEMLEALSHQIDEQASAKPTMMQALLDRSTSIKVIAKAQLASETAKAFVKNEPEFQKPFGLNPYIDDFKRLRMLQKGK